MALGKSGIGKRETDGAVAESDKRIDACKTSGNCWYGIGHTGWFSECGAGFGNFREASADHSSPR
ncbi:MAG TPA: hypothetical protein VHT23_03375 [Gemmatimonadaceae bacterium]|nr:hypothetical protein [Gemmatimonadaceae bacterium]